MASRSFTIDRDARAVRIGGELRIGDAAAFWEELRAVTDEAEAGTLELDVSDVRSIDGTVAALLVANRAQLAARGVRAEVVGAAPEIEPLLGLYGFEEPPPKPKRRKPESTIAQVGRTTLGYVGELKGVLAFLGEMVIAAMHLVRHPRSGHWREVPALAEKTGADAVPIVALINFLVGFVMAYQAANQLKMFGANIYVADLVGLSVTRELAPLMTAIIVCGRSGAAFAAELGSMKVSEEIDAIRTLGLRPFAWLVVPRVIALVLVVPFLVLLGDILGIAGGLFVGVTSLDLTVQGYFNETRKAVELWDIYHGLLKSLAFAIAIALIACQQGFSASGGAEGVGRRTTSTVVTCLFALVLLDALFTIVFQAFGL